MRGFGFLFFTVFLTANLFAQPKWIEDELLQSYIAEGDTHTGSSTRGTLAENRFGEPNTAIRFDGSQARSYQTNFLKRRDFTLSLWVKPSLERSDQILNCPFTAASDAAGGFVIGSYTSKNWEFYIWETGKAWKKVTTVVKATNWWTHVVLTHKDGYATFYINGVRRAHVEVDQYWANRDGVISVGASHLGNGNFGSHFKGLVDDIRIYDALSEKQVTELHSYEHEIRPRRAKAKAVLLNGFLVGVDVTDPGLKYIATSPPRVWITGANGDRVDATAEAIIEAGRVSAINVTDAGGGYSYAHVHIASPPFSTSIKLGVSKYETVIPPDEKPRTALAALELFNGFVVAATVIDGGQGYEEVPSVTIEGGGGNGAEAVATLRNGKVESIAITRAGNGYSSSPRIEVESPNLIDNSLPIATHVAMDMKLMAGFNYQIQTSVDLRNWTNLGDAFFAADESQSRVYKVNSKVRYYRALQLP